MNAKTTPRVSIGLPVFNGEQFLAEALDSLLTQTFTDFELIISDNASTDATPNICRRYAAKDPRIRYERSDVNRGAAKNFNNTFHLSRGEYFVWAAHDDLHEPIFLEKCVEVLDRDPSLVLCYSRTNFIDSRGQHTREFETVCLSNSSRRQRFLHCTSMEMGFQIFGMIRSEILRKTPLIASYVGSDLVLVGDLALFGGFYQVSECLFLHREHAGRSAIASKDARAYARWFDASRTGRFTMPHWRRLYEHAASVCRHQLPWSEKVALLLDICRVANWSRRRLASDIRHLMKQT